MPTITDFGSLISNLSNYEYEYITGSVHAVNQSLSYTTTKKYNNVLGVIITDNSSCGSSSLSSFYNANFTYDGGAGRNWFIRLVYGNNIPSGTTITMRTNGYLGGLFLFGS